MAHIGLLVAAGFAAILPAWWVYNWALQLLTHVPGIPGLPLLGNLLDYQNKTWHGLHHECTRRFGSVFRLWHGATQHIVVAAPEPAKQVLLKCPFRFMFPSPMPDSMSAIYTNGLVFARDMVFHRALKAMWLQAFLPGSLTGYVPIINDVTDKLLAVLELAAAPTPDGAPRYIDIHQLNSFTMLEITGTSAFGITLDSLSASAAELGGSIDHLLHRGTAGQQGSKVDVAAKRVVKSIHAMIAAGRPDNASMWMPLYLMFPWAKRLVVRMAQMLPDRPLQTLFAAVQELSQVSQELIDTERHLMTTATSTQAATGAAKRGLLPGTFLLHMIKVSEAAKAAGVKPGTGGDDSLIALTDEEMAGNVITFLAAGFDTTSNAISNALYLLSQPDAAGMLSRVLSEVDGLGPPGTIPSTDALLATGSMPVLEACINETLRFMTPVPYVFRYVGEDMDLAGCPHVKLAKDTRMQVSLAAVMRNPAVWPEPDRFLPARFISEEGAGLQAREPGGFVPWGGGVRMCVGRPLALLELKLVLVRIFQRFTFVPDPDFKIKLATGLTMAPENGIRMRVVARKP